MTDPIGRLRAALRATTPAIPEAARRRAAAAAAAAFDRQHRENRSAVGPGSRRAAATVSAPAGSLSTSISGRGHAGPSHEGRMEQMKTLDEMRQQLIDKAEDDLAFRSRLLAEPRAVVEEQFGIEVPESVELRVHEDSRSAVHLVLPPEPKLDMQELRTASGGICTYGCGGGW